MKRASTIETKPNAPAELNIKITGYIEDLTLETDETRISKVMQKYLDFEPPSTITAFSINS